MAKKIMDKNIMPHFKYMLKIYFSSIGIGALIGSIRARIKNGPSKFTSLIMCEGAFNGSIFVARYGFFMMLLLSIRHIYLIS